MFVVLMVMSVHQQFTGQILNNEKGVTISRNSLIFNALQDGLAPWALKLLEIFRNCKKLNIN